MAVLKSTDFPAINKKQIDTTGRHSIFQIHCKEILTDEDIQLLEAHLEKIDQKLAKLTTIVEPIPNKELLLMQPLNAKHSKFSFLNIDVLLKLSKNLGNNSMLSKETEEYDKFSI
ncbi:507_t:CDS:2 [Ambispora gerdemannii]|uniref:507_t:CDS:1 n=1 Tax=Ambispora gerdemannii TaxID=144530 RepID=A0A9N9CRG2_9GLOM|nr:507_t:CDS:2 [Ambispora gerdemannii]